MGPEASGQFLPEYRRGADQPQVADSVASASRAPYRDSGRSLSICGNARTQTIQEIPKTESVPLLFASLGGAAG